MYVLKSQVCKSEFYGGGIDFSQELSADLIKLSDMPLERFLTSKSESLRGEKWKIRWVEKHGAPTKSSLVANVLIVI